MVNLSDRLLCLLGLNGAKRTGTGTGTGTARIRLREREFEQGNSPSHIYITHVYQYLGFIHFHLPRLDAPLLTFFGISDVPSICMGNFVSMYSCSVDIVVICFSGRPKSFLIRNPFRMKEPVIAAP